MGDDATHARFEYQAQKKIFGYERAQTVTAEQLLDEARQTYHIFHVNINHHHDQQRTHVDDHWAGLLGKHAISLSDYRKLGLLVATIVAVMQGGDAGDTMRQENETTRRELLTTLDGLAL